MLKGSRLIFLAWLCPIVLWSYQLVKCLVSLCDITYVQHILVLQLVVNCIHGPFCSCRLNPPQAVLLQQTHNGPAFHLCRSSNKLFWTPCTKNWHAGYIYWAAIYLLNMSTADWHTHTPSLPQPHVHWTAFVQRCSQMLSTRDTSMFLFLFFFFCGISDRLNAVEKRHLLPLHSEGNMSFLLVKTKHWKSKDSIWTQIIMSVTPETFKAFRSTNNGYYVSFTWVLKHSSCYTFEVLLKLLVTCFASRATLAMCKTHMVPLLENYNYIPEFKMQTWNASLKMCTV